MNPTINKAVDKLYKQQEKGFRKYGQYVDPSSLEFRQWLQHLQEELLDAIIYIECSLAKLEELEKRRGGDVREKM